MITIHAVTKRFGRAAAVSDVSLEVRPGESLALWGANGAGKTTLIRCVLGLLRFSGRITVYGHDVRRDGKAARLAVGYVPQELGFYDDLGVAEAVVFFARLKGLGRTDPAGVLRRVGLDGHERKRIRELSGGMKQRLALTIALLGDPPVLVLDEVTASLDAVGREELVDLLGSLACAGRTMLFASHRLEEIGALAGRVAVLERGRLASVQSVDAFVSNASHGAAVHLVVDPAMRERALYSLRAEGFAATLNGVGVIVPVSAEHKAGPFRVLAEARIPVDDFEIVSSRRAAALSTHTPESRP